MKLRMNYKKCKEIKSKRKFYYFYDDIYSSLSTLSHDSHRFDNNENEILRVNLQITTRLSTLFNRKREVYNL